MACRRKAPGIWATPIPSASACCIRRTISSRPPRRWCCPPPQAARQVPTPIRSAPIPAQTCQTSDTPLNIADNGSKHAWSYGVYVQDEWKIFPRLTLNYGVRYDQYGAFNAENQLSPRANLVWTPTDTTTVHAGFARYFSPPPIELVASTDIALFDNTTAAGDHTDDLPKAERADYYDFGVVQKLFEGAQVGLDSFYKASRNMVDEGQFGAPIILTPFNYQTGRQYGGELSFNYQADGFSGYVNASYRRAEGRNIVSSQFQFGPTIWPISPTITFPLDHQQIGTVSAGASYKWEDVQLSADLLYGTACGGTAPRPMAIMCPPTPPSISGSATASISAASRA